MKLERYPTPQAFLDEALPLLMEDEVLNNLPIGIARRGAQNGPGENWLLATVKDDAGAIALAVVCTPPFNLVLAAPAAGASDEALAFLSAQLKALGFDVPGVICEQGLAHRFAEIHTGGNFRLAHTMKVMRLDNAPAIPEVPGHARPLREEDLYFAPYWNRAFGEECGVEVPTIPQATETLRARADRQTYLFWEVEGVPVAQAAQGRSTGNGAIISQVYTPPHFRGKGYASACVATLSAQLLAGNHTFCALFADAANPISCGIYRKLGYKDSGVCDEICFGVSP